MPVLLLTATDPALFAPAVAGVMVDLSDAVCLTYDRDADEALHRRVSDWSGPVYDELVGDASVCRDAAGHRRRLGHRRDARHRSSPSSVSTGSSTTSSATTSSTSAAWP